MATTTKSQLNGTTRRTLASQIDRLDDILDGLGEALNDSIAMAIEKAVQIAVEKAIENVVTAMLSKPELLANLQRKVAAKQPAIPKLNLLNRFVQIGQMVAMGWRKVRETCRRGVVWIRRTTCLICRKVGQPASRCWTKCRELAPPKGELFLALGVGVLIGVATYFAGPWLASVAGGLAGIATTLATKTVVRLRRMVECVMPMNGGETAVQI